MSNKTVSPRLLKLSLHLLVSIIFDKARGKVNKDMLSYQMQSTAESEFLKSLELVL